MNQHLSFLYTAFNTAALIALAYTAAPLSYASSVTISTNGEQRCVRSNGLPDHTTGQFPNNGNPHSIQQQRIDYCFPANPQKRTYSTPQRGSIGVALNGITIRPGTADYWDNSSHRGFSRDSSSGWNLEGLGSRKLLGMDHNNAHVDNRGLYHYHGVAPALVSSTHDRGSLIAYAADGFEIHYIPGQISSYQLKQGVRPSGPGGVYDGAYNEDWEYISGSSTLDQCNGGLLNGKFVYFATDTYPFFPRCLWGVASKDFGLGQGNPQQQNTFSSNHNKREGKKSHGHHHSHRRPPQAALSACSGLSRGKACSFNGRGHIIEGQCKQVPSGELACVPNKRRF